MDRAMHRPKEQSRPTIIFSSSAVKAQAEFEGGEDVAISMGSCMELRESEMSTCGTLGHTLEVPIACSSYMRGACQLGALRSLLYNI